MSSRTSTARTATTTPATPAVAPAASTAPQGSTSTSVVGTPQGQVAHLAHLAQYGITLVAPLAAWPGWGKAVRVQGNGWSGNFTPGDHLIWNQGNPGQIRIVFNTPVSDPGANIHSGAVTLFSFRYLGLAR